MNQSIRCLLFMLICLSLGGVSNAETVLVERDGMRTINKLISHEILIDAHELKLGSCGSIAIFSRKTPLVIKQSIMDEKSHIYLDASFINTWSAVTRKIVKVTVHCIKKKVQIDIEY